jgi:hypothetical protein
VVRSPGSPGPVGPWRSDVGTPGARNPGKTHARTRPRSPGRHHGRGAPVGRQFRPDRVEPSFSPG